MYARGDEAGRGIYTTPSICSCRAGRQRTGQDQYPREKKVRGDSVLPQFFPETRKTGAARTCAPQQSEQKHKATPVRSSVRMYKQLSNTDNRYQVPRHFTPVRGGKQWNRTPILLFPFLSSPNSPSTGGITLHIEIAPWWLYLASEARTARDLPTSPPAWPPVRLFDLRPGFAPVTAAALSS